MLCQRHVEDLPVDLARCQLCHLNHELLGQVEGDANTPIGESLHLVHDGPELNRLHTPPVPLAALLSTHYGQPTRRSR